MSSEDMNANMATTENENNVAENNELNELRESNANLIAERGNQSNIRTTAGQLASQSLLNISCPLKMVNHYYFLRN